MRKSRTRLYRIYNNMKQRCGNPHNTVYKYYGGKGVSVCDEWKNSFKEFEKWADEHGYNDSLTIDRIDNTKGYSPDNCRIVSMKEQGNNRKSNRVIEYNGEKKTLMQWAEDLGIDHRTLWRRLEMWPVEKAFTEPVNTSFRSRSITYNGETHTIWDWAKIAGMKPSTLSDRLNRQGLSIDKALATPVKGGACANG